MSNYSKIEWTEVTWNPLRGCSKISPGCKNCYASTFAERFCGVVGSPYEQGFDLRLIPKKLAEPFTWAAPRVVFVNSMSDLFQDGVPDSYIEAVAQVMSDANWHTYQVLTKRADRMRQLLDTKLDFAGRQSHIWWGVSVEDKKFGLPRIEHLRASRATIRFLSIEPLLEDLGDFDLTGIHWVIVGGESGHGARPMKQEWVERILHLCRAANVPFFFKQWGGVHKSRTGRQLLGRTFDEMPERTSRPIPSRSTRLAAVREWEHKAVNWDDTLVKLSPAGPQFPLPPR
jgi:protein gp37